MTETAAPAANEAASSAAAGTSQAALDALLCDVLPRQGFWSDEAYLWLTDHARRRIEFTDGRIEELPAPTFTHQAVLLFLYRLFHDYLQPRGGVAMVSGLRMRIREGKFREPDLLMLRERSNPRFQDRYWLGADLVAEVVSPDDPDRVWRSVPTTPVEETCGSSMLATSDHPDSRWTAVRQARRIARNLDETRRRSTDSSADVSAVFDAPDRGVKRAPGATRWLIAKAGDLPTAEGTRIRMLFHTQCLPASCGNEPGPRCRCHQCVAR